MDDIPWARLGRVRETVPDAIEQLEPSEVSLIEME